MLLMRIERWDPHRDGPLTEGALRQKIENLGCDVITRLYPAGAIAAAQSDEQVRLLAVARGLVKITLGAESAILGPGDLVSVPRGVVRRVEAIGAVAACCVEAGSRTDQG